MEFHPYCLLFPEMDAAGLQELADDIRKNGLQQPVIEHEGKILDGRNRYKACQLAGATPIFDVYQGKDALGFVISHNLHRRHLTESQRTEIAHSLVTTQLGTNQYAEGAPIGAPITQKRAAQMLQVSRRNVQRMAKVDREGPSQVSAFIKSGLVTVNEGLDFVKLPPAKQREIVAGGPEAVKAAAGVVRRTMPDPHPTVTVTNLRPKDMEPDLAPIKPVDPSIKYVPDLGMGVAEIAITQLKTITDGDASHIAALEKVIQYCTTKIQALKS